MLNLAKTALQFKCFDRHERLLVHILIYVQYFWLATEILCGMLTAIRVRAC